QKLTPIVFKTSLIEIQAQYDLYITCPTLNAEYFIQKLILLQQLFITFNKNIGPKPHCCVAPTVVLHARKTQK
ncbi:MAG: hypothetical protein MK105_16360, partial [Crocinitomicaceae bacterium]|nr:hypothetical protein [Crocinitomicaceae bacterium]